MQTVHLTGVSWCVESMDGFYFGIIGRETLFRKLESEETYWWFVKSACLFWKRRRHGCLEFCRRWWFIGYVAYTRDALGHLLDEMVEYFGCRRYSHDQAFITSQTNTSRESCDVSRFFFQFDSVVAFLQVDGGEYRGAI